MEVHHHSHSARKKWTHYFWEFLMLFLAVFCGFLAEYRLEHTLEHQRGKQYASTMLEDLKADKEALESGIHSNQIIFNHIDTLLALHHPDSTHTRTNGQLYYYGRYALRFWYYVNKQVTLQQMKHSGTIRYFQNSALENQMVGLDKLVSFIKYWDDREMLYTQHAINYSGRLFHYAVLNSIPVYKEILEKDERTDASEQMAWSKTSFLQSNPPLVNKQVELTNEFLNFCNQRLPVLKAKIAIYKEALSEIDRMTAVLQEEYHLRKN